MLKYKYYGDNPVLAKLNEAAWRKETAEEKISNTKTNLLNHLIKLLAFKSAKDAGHHFSTIDNQVLKLIFETIQNAEKPKSFTADYISELLMFRNLDFKVKRIVKGFQTGRYSTLPRLYPDEFIIDKLPSIYKKLAEHILAAEIEDDLDTEEVFKSLGIEIPRY